MAGHSRQDTEARTEAPPVLEAEPVPPVSRPLPILDDDAAGIRVWERPAHEWKVRLGVFLFACLIFLPNLGAFGLWDPWETHYGAVTTNMVETHDWISLWWGYKEQIGSEARQGNYFFSKPIFIFWSEGFFASLLGRGEWAIRLPMAMLAIFATFFVYLTMSRIWSRRAGLLGALITATAPEFFMISRQAQTDMPFVGTMLIGLCFLMLAMFGPRERLTKRGFWSWVWGTLVFVLLNTIPQFAIIATDLNDDAPANLSGLKWLGHQIQHTGAFHVAIYATALLVLLGWLFLDLRRDLDREGLSDRVKDRWQRRCMLFVFYVMVAQATYAKGLLGFGLPGLIILTYLVFTARWRTLARVELVRGPLLALIVGLPWYVAMFARHGQAYYQRFFIHDHFNRLAAGVHQIDSGNFEHFIKWLGFGMFPWAVFVPLTLGWLVVQSVRDTRGESQAKLFLTFWFVTAFTFFTLASTKFHHYIFPAFPALAMLTALFLDRLLDDRGRLGRIAAVIGILFFAVLARDLHEDPQHLRNLMTYKYDRPLPEHLPVDADAPVSRGSDTTWAESSFWAHSSPTLHDILTTPLFRYERWMKFIAVVGFLALALFFAARTRRAGLAGLGLLAAMLAMWSLNYYMPTLSPHWSQKYLFDAYYDSCERVENPPAVREAYTPFVADIGLPGVARFFRWEQKKVCEEDVISWRITWRGETYYSFNELQPIGKVAEQFLPYLENRNHGQTFYALMERGKMAGFENKLESYSNKLRRKGVEGFGDIRDWDVEVIEDSNLYFQMIRAEPVRE
ncbi:MAG: ArnT family glycosyltransferase [Myxococcota bacterium]